MSPLFIFGAVRFSAAIADSACITDICAKLHIISDYHEFNNGNFCFTVPYTSERKLTYILEKHGYPFTVLRRSGVLPFLAKYRHRHGLIPGILLFIITVSFLPKFIWQIDIIGNDKLTDKDVLVALEECGLSLGTYLPGLKTDRIESEVLVRETRISWISVNINGTSAYVEIRERTDADKPIRNLPYANVISLEDAIVTEIETFSGMAAVKPGDYVRKGEMLINGIISNEAIGTYPTYAGGRIIGRVFREYEIELPYKYQKLSNSGRSLYKVYVEIFGKPFSLSSSDIEYENYTEIPTVHTVSNANKSLPFVIHVTKISEQIQKSEYRTPSDAQKEALRILENRILRDYPNAETVSKYITVTTTENSVIINANVEIECEIGETSEFDIDQ